MIKILYEGTHHLVVHDKAKDLCYLTDLELNRKSNFYKSIAQFQWREADTLYIAQPYKEGERKLLMEGEAIGRAVFGVTPKFTSPGKFVWAPNGENVFAREVSIDVYEPVIDATTGYPIHHFGAMRQLVDPSQGTATELAHEFFLADGKMYGKKGAETVAVSFKRPTKQIWEMIQEMSKR